MSGAEPFSSSVKSGLLICAAVTVVMFAPVYIYGLLQWARNREHILIQKRFPNLCLSLATSFVLAGVAMSIAHWSNQYTTFARLSSGISIAAYGLVNVRLYRIIARDRKHRQLSLEIVDHVALSDRFQTVSILGLHVFGVSSFLCLTISPYIVPQSTAVLRIAAWAIHIVITLCLLFHIWHKQVKDGIGCLKEALLHLAVVFVLAVPILILSVHNNLSMMMLQVLLVITPFLHSLIPLYGGLYYVRKMNALNAQASTEIEQSLPNFLSRYENYAMLTQYLTHCWAPETLMFVQRVCIVNHIVVSRRRHQSPSPIDVPAGAPALPGLMMAVLSLNVFDFRQFKFEYLTKLYTHYNAIIRTDEGDDNNTEGLKLVVLNIYRRIYMRFVAVGSVDEVNISWKTRSELISKFEVDDDVDDLDAVLGLFTDALTEVHDLIQSMYGQGFKQYVQDHITRNELDLITVPSSGHQSPSS